MFTLEQQRDALIAANERWLREQGVTIDTDYCHSRNITGEPSEKNRTYRASNDCWARGLRGRTVGTVTTDGIQTVRVVTHALPSGHYGPTGPETIVPVSHFRAEKAARKARKTQELSAARERQLAAQERLQATLQSHAIGNVE